MNTPSSPSPVPAVSLEAVQPAPTFLAIAAEAHKNGQPVCYRWKYCTNVGRLVKGECSTTEELRKVFSRHSGNGGTDNKNFRQFSTDQGRTWSDY